MPPPANQERVNKLFEIISLISEVGGKKELTKIQPNAEVIDASPADLSSDYIIVRDEEGYYIPAVLVAGLTPAIGDFVNLLYIKGTEPIAFQQGSASSGSPALPAATQIGQVLFSVDGLTFTVELPLTGEGGWLVNNDGVLLVV